MNNPNPLFIKMAEGQMNDSLPVEKVQLPRTQNPVATQSTPSPDLPSESFLFSYDHSQHGQFFQELITKTNETFSGTHAEIPTGTSGDVPGNLIKRLGLITTIYNDPQLRSANIYPITPAQSEALLKDGKLLHPDKYWEDLALILYDTNGENPEEAQALKESIIRHRTDLGLSQNDLENRLIIVNAGLEKDSGSDYGVKPIVLPGLTQVYTHEILDKNGENHKFEYGLEKGLPSVNEVGKGKRTLYMPSGNDIGLRVLFRMRYLDLSAGYGYLSGSNVGGRVNFAPQGSPKN